MTEANWLGEPDAGAMLKLAISSWSCWYCHYGWQHRIRPEFEPCPECAGSPHDRVLTPRKLRLLGCGFCRAIWDDLTGEPAREAVTVAERFADGRATRAELSRARARSTAPAAREAADPSSLQAATGAFDEAVARRRAIREAELSADLHDQLTQLYANVESSYGRLGRKAVKGIVRLRERHFRDDFSERVNRAVTEERRRFRGVLLDVIGNPFGPVPIKVDWLLADGGRVRQVAAGIYAEGDFAAMPVLADALQDAGCQDARLLDHCLEDGHYRGCWLLDAILGQR